MAKKRLTPSNIFTRATGEEWQAAATTKGSGKLALFRLINRKGSFRDNLKYAYGKKKR